MKKFLAAALVVLMLLSIVPMSVFAAGVDYNVSDSGCDFYNLIEKNDYNLASGAVESEIILNDDSGANRNVLHVIEVDLSNPNISVMPTYKGLNENSDFEDSNQWGAEVLTEQAAHVENNLGLNVVGGMNTCLRYNNNHPYGVLVWNGKVYSDERDANGVSTAQTFLAVSKDGVASLHSASEAIPEGTYQAISANFGWIIKDGVNQYSDDHADSGRAPRSVLAIKETGELILLMNDGRQAPFSAGATMGELAEWLLAMGCVDAVNCDGGGSSTFISEREGTGELTMKSSPSDGSQRATLGGILVISKAVADGKFDHAAVYTDDTYVTPGSTVEFTATGADSAGGPAEIPADAVWQLADPEMGVIENGVFTSTGKTGTATAQLVLNGEVVGEDSVEVVIPTAVKFALDNITVPFGKPLSFEVIATVNDGIHTVRTQESDFVFTLSDDTLGSIDGNVFTAATDATVTSGTVTVTFKDTEVSATANLYLGRGSEVVYDFEDGSTKNLTWQSGYLARSAVGRGETGTMEVVTAENGKVHSGDRALKLVADFRRGTAAGYREMRLNNLGIDLTDAVSVGMWIYMPADAIGHDARWLNIAGTQIGTGVAFGDCGSKYAEDGWYYVSIPVTAAHGDLQGLRMGVNDVSTDEAWNWFGKYTFYIDDITVDYSSAVDDREAPVFTDVYVAYGDSDTASVLNGQTVNENVITVYASVAENTTKTNYTGINVSSAKVYVDGVALTSGYTYSSDGRINVVDINLSNGVHTFKFEIADNMGNISTITRQVVVNDNNGDVRFVPATPEADKIPIGSIQYFNLVADNIENIDKVTAVIDLDAMSTWELEGMESAIGFTATYTIDTDTNKATVTVEKTGKVSATGEAVLAKIPARTWESTFHLNNNNPELVTDNPSNQDKAMILTPHAMWYSDGMWKVAIVAQAESIDVIYTDKTTDTFSSEEYLISTELYFHYSKRLESRKDEWSWHVHTSVAVEDKPATCTESGYTGRTVCAGCSCGTVENLGNECSTHEGCGSVVDWGTTIPATGHEFKIIDGNYACECGEVSNVTGLVEYDGRTYYAIDGKLQIKWQQIGDQWYYFHYQNYYGFNGTYGIKEYFGFPVAGSYTFDDGKLVSGIWSNVNGQYKYYYGPSYYVNGWKTIDSQQYYFDKEGYCLTGYQLICPNKNDPTPVYYMYLFDDKGVSQGLVSGIVDGVYYMDGLAYEAGLILIDGSLYYVKAGGWVVKNDSRYVPDTAISDEVRALGFTAGVYAFDENGKYIIKNGVFDGYYYENDKRVEAGLIKIDDALYYVKAGGWVVMNGSRYVPDEAISDEVRALGFKAGVYEFDAEGKFIIKNGVVGDTYYENGQAVEAGLIKIDDALYYVKAGGWVVKNGSRYVPDTAISDEVRALGFEAGVYAFDAEGKFVIKNGIVGDTYYVNGQAVEAGLIKIGDALYYVKAGGWVVKNGSRYVPDTAISDEVRALGFEAGVYNFDADGKHVLKNGIINGTYYENGKAVEAGLIRLDGKIYYVKAGGWVVTNGSRYVADTVISAELKREGFVAGVYTFDATGALVL